MGDSSLIDFGALFSQLLATYWWLLPLLVLGALFKSPWFKGFIGEVMINMAARLFLDKNDYHLTWNAEEGAEPVANCDQLECQTVKPDTATFMITCEMRETSPDPSRAHLNCVKK